MTLATTHLFPFTYMLMTFRGYQKTGNSLSPPPSHVCATSTTGHLSNGLTKIKNKKNGF